MPEYLIIVGLLFFATLAILRREYGVYLILLLLPSYQIRFSVFGLPMTFLEGMILILAAVSFPLLFRQYRNIQISQYLPILLFLLAGFISIFVSPVRLAAAGIFKAYFFEPVLFFFLVRAIIDTPEKVRRLFQSLSLLVIYLSVFGLYQFVTLYGLPFSWWEVNVAGRRIISLLNHPTARALLRGPPLGMLIFRPQKTRLDWTAFALGLPVFYLTVSRAGWLALAAAVVITAIIGAKRLSIINYKLLILAAAFSLAAVILIPFSRHLLLELATGRAATQENRYVLWTAAADMLKKQPLTGVGLMGFREHYKNYPLGPDRVVQNYPHNFFLNFWLETGPLGLISMVWLLVLFYKKRPLNPAVFAAMTVILLHGLVDVPYFKNDLAVLFWLIYGLPGLD